MKLKVDLMDLIHMPEFCYFLGLLYADGHICQRKDTSKRASYSVFISTTEENLDYFHNIFDKFCDFSIYNKKTPKKWKPSYTLSFSIKELHCYLVELGFDNKTQNAEKILTNIKSPLCTQAFFAGYFDGDGCVYFHEKQFLKQLSIASGYDQNWDFITQLCAELDIKNYNIATRVRKNGTSSSFRICNKKEFEIFLNYIYGNEKFGFERKKEKFKQAMLLCKDGKQFNPELRNIKCITHYDKS